MRVVSVVDTFPRLSETFILRKAMALADRGHDVLIFARATGDWKSLDQALPARLSFTAPLAENELWRPVRLYAFLRRAAGYVALSPISSLRLLMACLRSPETRRRPVVNFVRHLPFVKLKADIVHLEFLDIASTYPLLGSLMKSPLVISCRGADLHFIHLKAPRAQEAARTALRRAAAIHCVSDEMAHCVRTFCGRSASVWVNRPAVPTDRIAPVPRLPRPAPLILATGRLVPKKGFDVLLNAASELSRKGISYRLDIIGEGPERRCLERQIAALGLSSAVSLVGARPPDEVLRRMQSADLFVLSSREEGISNAVLEAMASSLPVVTTAAGGMEEAVREGVDGYVVPIDNANALAAAVAELLADDGLRARMGQSGRDRALAEFSLSRQAILFEEMYTAISQSASGS